MTKSIQLTAADRHTFSVYCAEPEGKPRGSIVLIQEIFGVNSHIRQVADGYATDGYCVFAPALFDRVEPDVEIGYTPEDIQRGYALMSKLKIEAVLADVSATIDEATKAGKVGIVGYCWGGYVSWMTAARNNKLACAVVYYGGGVTDHIQEQPLCPVLLHFGEKDMHIPLEGVKQLQVAHPKQQVHIYAADHGFNCDQRGSYDAAAATLARERTLAFFRQHLG